MVIIIYDLKNLFLRFRSLKKKKKNGCTVSGVNTIRGTQVAWRKKNGFTREGFILKYNKLRIRHVYAFLIRLKPVT